MDAVVEGVEEMRTQHSKVVEEAIEAMESRGRELFHQKRLLQQTRRDEVERSKALALEAVVEDKIEAMMSKAAAEDSLEKQSCINRRLQPKRMLLRTPVARRQTPRSSCRRN